MWYVFWGQVNPKTGKVKGWAKEIIEMMGSYTEVSPSGTGVKIIIKGTLPGNGIKKGNIEIYDKGRYFTITGWHLEGTPKRILRRPKSLRALLEKITEKGQSDTDKKCDIKPSTLTDNEIIERAKKANNGDKFKRLWEGNISGYNSRSEADLALCAILAFWAVRDSSRIDNLFRQSGLMREKWDKIHDPNNNRTYGQMTIDEAIVRFSIP
jgi:primase-polymerase (primpol)-like protein